MTRYKRVLIISIAALGAVFVLGYQAQSSAKQRLQIGGGSANFGVHALNGGFMPDPRAIAVTSGGNLDVSAMGLGPGCRGYATARPDAILRYNNPASFLRFFVRASGDTTLVVNAGDGSWHCDDDSGGSLNPMVDIQGPPGGQYDIWVGSYRAGENIRGSLNVTELMGNRP